MIVIENFGIELSPLVINKDLLYKFKDECDVQLAVLHRELTRGLVDYTLFQQLQNINNDVFRIINSLEIEEYTTIKEIEDDRHILVSDLDTFLSHCKVDIDADIYEPIYEHSNYISTAVFKLVQIVKDIDQNNKDK